MPHIIKVSLLLLGLMGYPAWVSAACHVATTGLNFGAYDVFDTTDVRSTARLTVMCDLALPTPVTLALGPSAHTGLALPRGMTLGASVLYYNVYIDPALTRVWGDGTGGGRAMTNSVTRNTPWAITVYGSIPAQQSVRAGVYSDRVIVTITW